MSRAAAGVPPASAPPANAAADGPAKGRVTTLAHRAEYAAWRVIVALLSLLSWRAAGSIGAALGKLGFWPIGIRRRLVEHQLAAAFPELDAAERRRIAIGSYANLGRLAVESAIISNLPPGAVLEHFHPPVGWDHIAGPVSAGQGVILVAGHLGNWELGMAYIAARGIKVSAVVRQMGNPLFDRYVTGARTRFGWNVIPDRDAVRALPRAIRDANVVPMLADQGVQGLSAEFVPFFGRLARTPRGPALLALRLKAACVFVAIALEPDGKYGIYFEPVPLTDTGDRDRDVPVIVAAYTRQLESWVRKYPDQYLWQHRRWRRRPDGTLEDV
jgi:KDO2-lipid IV(A) lauroyltransferase